MTNRSVHAAMLVLILSGCTAVLDKGLMQEGAREFRLGHLRETPEVFKDHLFILGGLIVETKLLEEGSQIEALFVPVDRYGYLREGGRSEGRFLALFPRAKGMLDPVVFRKGRQVTLAGDFMGLRRGKIDEMEYSYPVFAIRQVHLWEDYYDYPIQLYPYSYPYHYFAPMWCHDPWSRPYPCPTPWYRPMW